MADKGVPGLAIAAAAAGLIYFWAGWKGASVSDTLKSLLTGEAPSGTNVNPIDVQAGGTGGGSSGGPVGPLSSNAVVAFAQKQIGIQYQFGGGNGKSPTVGTNSAKNGRPGWDCSGLTQAAWLQGGGVHLGHYVPAQYAETSRVSKSSLQPSDIVFFHGDGVLGHCGLYIGNDQFIEAAHTGTNVRVSKLSTRGDYVGGGRPKG
jgi:cell wall-associated NlpC family hydrolase